MNRRRARTRRVWMRLKSPDILRAHMEHKKFSMSRLARYAGCSRQFIYMLLNGDKSTCSEPLAEALVEALDAPIEALFDRMESAVSVRNSGNRQTRKAS